MKTLRFLLIFAAIVLLSAGTPFTKPSKTSRGKASTNKKEAVAPPCDTLFSPPRDSVVVAGFEKTLRSPRESMYITNRYAVPLSSVGITITYTDTKGRMLHKVSHDISADIPSGETRLVEIQSFDRQALYYYRLSPAPTRASHATPFDVDVTVTYITTPKNHTK